MDSARLARVGSVLERPCRSSRSPGLENRSLLALPDSRLNARHPWFVNAKKMDEISPSKTSTWDRLDMHGQPVRVTLTELKHAGVVGLRLEGPKITRIGVVNIESGKWSPLNLDEPASGVIEPMDLGPGACAYQVGRLVYVYHSRTSKWDRLDINADDKQVLLRPKANEACLAAGTMPRGTM